MVNTTTELVSGDPELVSILTKNKETFEALFYGQLKKGEPSGEIPEGKDLKAIASLIFVLYGGIRVVAKLSLTKKLMASIKPVLGLLH